MKTKIIFRAIVLLLLFGFVYAVIQDQKLKSSSQAALKETSNARGPQDSGRMIVDTTGKQNIHIKKQKIKALDKLRKLDLAVSKIILVNPRDDEINSTDISNAIKSFVNYDSTKNGVSLKLKIDLYENKPEKQDEVCEIFEDHTTYKNFETKKYQLTKIDLRCSFYGSFDPQLLIEKSYAQLSDIISLQ